MKGTKIKDIPDYLELPEDQQLMIMRNGRVTTVDNYLEPEDIIVLRPKY